MKCKKTMSSSCLVFDKHNVANSFDHLHHANLRCGPYQVEVAKMERERMKLALEDRPVRSEFEALNELHEDRLRTAEAELRRLIAELSNRLQVCRM